VVFTRPRRAPAQKGLSGGKKRSPKPWKQRLEDGFDTDKGAAREDGARGNSFGVVCPKKGFFTPKKGFFTPKKGGFTPKKGFFTPKKGVFTPKKGLDAAR